LQSHISQYKLVNQSIEKLQSQLKTVQGQVGNLYKDTSFLAFGKLRCPSLPPPGYPVAFCEEGDPPSFFQVTAAGEKRPISSMSQVGFQDRSVAAKPTCSAANRGTFYVEKGIGTVADKPFLCARKSGNTYGWVQLGTIP
jgi:hypothetical protein